jgi:hypothetical protein
LQRFAALDDVVESINILYMQTDRQADGIQSAVAAAHFFIVRTTGILCFYNGLVDGHGAGTSRERLPLIGFVQGWLDNVIVAALVGAVNS